MSDSLGNNLNLLQSQIDSREDESVFKIQAPTWRINQTIQKIAQDSFAVAKEPDLLKAHRLYQKSSELVAEPDGRAFQVVNHVTDVFARFLGISLEDSISPLQSFEKALYSDEEIIKRLVGALAVSLDLI